MEHSIKAQVLKEIMEAMMKRDADRLRPKEPEILRTEESKIDPPELSEDGHDSDMSDEDHGILSQLFGSDLKGEEDSDEEEEALLS